MTVTDDGRGIPVDVKKEYKKSALELVLTTLHAGGKFSRRAVPVLGRPARRRLVGRQRAVGGAHRRRSSATARCGSRSTSAARRSPSCARSARRAAPARRSPSAPTREIFGKQEFSAETIRFRLDAKAFLHKGLTIVFKDEKAGTKETFQHEGGIADFLAKVVADRGKPPTAPQVFYFERGGEAGFRHRGGAAVDRVARRDDPLVRERHPDARRAARTSRGSARRSSRRCAPSWRPPTWRPKGITVTAEDVREGLVGVLSVYMSEPQFQGQTKERLGSPEAQAQVDSAVRPALERFLLENKTAGAAIVERIALAAKAREASRAAAQAVSRKTAVSHRLNLPGKLADCASTDPAKSELFIVEGDSRRRLRQAGARAQDAGDPSAARQGAERRAGLAAEGALEQGAAGRRLRAGLRRRRGLQDRAPPLPQDHPADGRRLRRPPHRDAAADLLLPAPAAADRAAASSTWRSRRCTGSTTASRPSGRWTSRTASGSSPACRRTRVPTSCGSRVSARCSPKS